MGGCLSFSKNYNELHKSTDKSTDKPINPDIDCDDINSDINKTPSIKFIENYIGNEYSISKSIETSNRLDNLIRYLENDNNDNVNSQSIYGRCDNDSEISGTNSSINEITVKSHTFIITRSDSEIDKIDRRYTL